MFYIHCRFSLNCTVRNLYKFTCTLSINFIVIGTMSEINQLRLALQESSTARNVVEGQCISLKVCCVQCFHEYNDICFHYKTAYFCFCNFISQHELSELQEQVKMYESASRLGVGLGSNSHNDSLPHLTVRNLNKENWSTPKSQ